MLTKVTSVSPTGETWTSQDGKTFYKQQVTLADGTTGTSLTANPEAPYTAGDEVEVTTKQTKHGIQFSIRKQNDNPPTFKPGGSFRSGNDPGKGLAIARQSSLKAAVGILGEGKPVEQYLQLAERITQYVQNGPEQGNQGNQPRPQDQYSNQPDFNAPF